MLRASLLPAFFLLPTVIPSQFNTAKTLQAWDKCDIRHQVLPVFDGTGVTAVLSSTFSTLEVKLSIFVLSV